MIFGNFFQEILQDALKFRCIFDRMTAEINPNDWMLLPLIRAVIEPQSFEQLFIALENLVQGGDQQALAEAARSGEKIDALGVPDQLVEILRLINVEVSAVDQVAECLDAGW
ncbi:hypothetical protein GMJAKD_06655 [Candidatus Electrothrix aarhusensis]